jgi:hypothetical protein
VERKRFDYSGTGPSQRKTLLIAKLDQLARDVHFISALAEFRTLVGKAKARLETSFRRSLASRLLGSLRDRDRVGPDDARALTPSDHDASRPW